MTDQLLLLGAPTPVVRTVASRCPASQVIACDLPLAPQWAPPKGSRAALVWLDDPRTVRALRKRWPELPLITLAASPDRALVEQAAAHGADGHLTLMDLNAELLFGTVCLGQARRAEAALQASRLSELDACYAALLDAPMVPTFLYRAGRIRQANKALAALLEQPLEALIGQDPMGLVEEGDRFAMRNSLAVWSEEPARMRWIRASGEPVLCAVTARNFRLEGLPARFTFLEPVDAGDSGERFDRRAFEAEVQRRTAELTAVNRELETFSYALSHDLQAPLRTIRGFSAALLEDYAAVLDEDGATFLRRMDAAAGRMSGMIDDMLTLAGVTRGPINLTEVDLTALVEALLDELAAAEPHRDVQRQVEAEVSAVGDPSLLGTLIQNLLGNAWKYSDGRAQAVVSFGRDGDAYFVRDNGPGFPMEDVDRLFRAFERGANERQPGSGLGLATAARIARRHGGRIWAESQPGAGATFFFTLGD
jgi:signal transduction histidine kinase